MTQHRDFKRLVRTRAARTGESYMAARASLLKKPGSASPSATTLPVEAPAPDARGAPQVPAVAPADYAKLAGMSDAALAAKTGCGWEKWVHSLDHVNAQAWPHREIARYVRETYKQPGWWAQTVAVGYERIRGLRDAGQRRGGGYVVNKSRTIDAGVGMLYRMVREPRLRATWIPALNVALRSATQGKVVRFTCTADGTSVEVRLESKGRGRASVVVQHEGIASKETAQQLRGWWTERLEALASVTAAAPRTARAKSPR